MSDTEIQLDPDKIKKNSGMRMLCKLMLNSFGGKFRECLKKPQTVVITNASDLYHAVSNPLHEINSICICTDDLLEIVCTPLDTKVKDPRQTNIFIAASTTCSA